MPAPIVRKTCLFEGCDCEFIGPTGVCQEHYGSMCHVCGAQAVRFCMTEGCSAFVCGNHRYCVDHADQEQYVESTKSIISGLVAAEYRMSTGRFGVTAKVDAIKVLGDAITLLRGLKAVVVISGKNKGIELCPDAEFVEKKIEQLEAAAEAADAKKAERAAKKTAKHEPDDDDDDDS